MGVPAIERVRAYFADTAGTAAKFMARPDGPRLGALLSQWRAFRIPSDHAGLRRLAWLVPVAALGMFLCLSVVSAIDTGEASTTERAEYVLQRSVADTGLWAMTRGGPKVGVANVVVQTVPYKQVGGRHAGTAVESAHVIGKGTVEVFSGSAGGSGTAAPGTWSKPHLNQLTNYMDGNDFPMAFQPGPTWVIFAPKGTKVSTSGGQ